MWVNREGRELAAIVDAPLPRPEQLRLSPDGTRLAVIDSGDIWVYDLGGRPPMKLTSGAHNDMLLWSPDGKDIIYARTQPPTRLFSVRVWTPAARPHLSHRWGTITHTHGRRMGRFYCPVLNSYSPSGWDILTIPREGRGAPVPL